MYSVGIDVSKGKSAVCIMGLGGTCNSRPFEIKHEKEGLDKLLELLKKLAKKEDIKVVMEAIGIYHWPVFNFLKENGYFVTVVNPLKMKVFSKNVNFRSVKTDKIDSMIISTFGVEKWRLLENSEVSNDDREKLRRLTRTYDSYQKPKVNLKQIMDLELEKAMPGIKDIIDDDNKLCDFIMEFKHFDNIKKLSLEKFINKFNKWKKKKDYRFHSDTSIKIYNVASQAIPTVPNDDVCKLTLTSSVKALKSINEVLDDILSQASALAHTMSEYETVRKMNVVGDIMATRLISEIGDIRLLNNKKSLVCMARIDVPPYESGQFIATERHITKKGNSHLRKDLYLTVQGLIKIKPKEDNAVYLYIQKKREEGFHTNKAIVAGMRKFLHVYYARVKELYISQGIWKLTE